MASAANTDLEQDVRDIYEEPASGLFRSLPRSVGYKCKFVGEQCRDETERAIVGKQGES